ncbi:MAG: hypothetical protein ACREGR_03380 [Minisyncoccia bacterium]
MSELTFDVGLAAKLKQAVIRNGIIDLADIDWLCEGDNLANVRRLRQGHVLLTVPEHLIDCDADLFNPWAKDGWTVDEHQKGGQWKFDPKQVEFFLSSGQKGSKTIEGNKLRKELAGKPVLNANVLDYLLKNPHLIPEEWKKDAQGNTRYIFFWGTVYRDRGGSLYVRCLDWSDGSWDWSISWLDGRWDGDNPAAVRAS